MKRKLCLVLLLLLCLMPFTRAAAAAPPLKATIALTPNPVPAGGDMNIKVNIEGGIAPYRCFTRIHFQDDGGEEFIVELKGTGTQQTYKMIHGKTGYVETEVHDVRGAVITVKSAPFTVSGTHANELKATVTTDGTWYGPGTHVTASCLAQGGTPPYFYTYALYVNESGTLRNVDWDTVDTPTYTFVEPLPNVGGSGLVTVKVTDAAGRMVQREQAIQLTATVVNPLIITSAILSRDVVEIGVIQITGIELTVQGGTPPYRVTYVWEIFENGAPVASRVDNNAVTLQSNYAPLFGEYGTVYASVFDAEGRSATTNTLRFEIKGGITGEPFEVSSKLSAVNASDGGVALTTQATVRGGQPPFTYTFGWADYDSNHNTVWAPEKTYKQADRTAQAFRSYPPGGNQPRAVTLQVTDAMGRASNTQWHDYTGVTQQQLPGDANGDNMLDVTDLAGIIQYILNPGYLLASPHNADANGDGIVDIADLVWVINRLL